MTAPIHSWLVDPLAPEVRSVVQRITAADDVVHVAIMPDVHLAGDACVGSAVATSSRIYPALIGGDIGCGMLAVRLNGEAAALDSETAAAAVLSALEQRVPTNRHRAATAIAMLPDELEASQLSTTRLQRIAARDGRVQLGTLGRGNHFLEFQRDEDGQLWLMVHSGSRGIGQAVAAAHILKAKPGRGGLCSFEADSEEGQAYLNDADWAVRYAATNRLVMAMAASSIIQTQFSIGCDWPTLIHENHNHVRAETHFGQSVWVHRKGAQTSADGQIGITPGSMATESFHVIGRGCPDSLRSSAHGAGRRLTRTSARKRISIPQLEGQMGAVWFDHRKSRRFVEESPEAYRDIRSVMRAQRDLVKIRTKLSPLIAYKG